MDAQDFGEVLRHYRHAVGMTQEELAEQSGLSVRGISDLERGVRRRPQAETVRMLASALNIAPADLSPGSAGPRRSGLPIAGILRRPLTPLIGRDADAAQVHALLAPGSNHRLVTLTGPGGIGKTRLAREIGFDLRDAYEHGVAYVSLASLADHRLVLPALAAALDIRDHSHRSPMTFLSQWLQGRRLLAVLDNLEHLLASAPAIADLLERCPQLCMLVTSRAPLRVAGEQEVPVRPLAVPKAGQPVSVENLASVPSVQLLVHHIQSGHPGFVLTESNAAAVSNVCGLLEGIPLALELAAPRIAATGLETLASMLESRLGVLTGGGPDRPMRQRTMLATISWSHDLLTPLDQVAFRRFAVFSGGARFESAVEVLGMGTEIETLDRLTALLDQSLIHGYEGRDGKHRFAMLETIREFARKKLAESDDEVTVSRRHAEHFVSLAEQARRGANGGDDRGWPRRLETEASNLRTALSWAFQQRDATTAQRFVASFLTGDVHVLAPADERFSWARQALELGPGTSPTSYGETLLVASQLSSVIGNPAASETYARAALERARRDGDSWLSALAEHHLGNALANKLEFAAADQSWANVLAVIDTFDHPWARSVASRTACYRVRVRLDEEDLETARTLMAECQARTAVLDRPWDTAFNVSLKLADMARLEGNLLSAISHAQDALAVFWDLHDERYLVDALLSLARSLAVNPALAVTAATLIGAVDALSEEVGLVIDPHWIDPIVRALASALGAERLTLAREDGRTMDLAEIVAMAMVPVSDPFITTAR